RRDLRHHRWWYQQSFARRDHGCVRNDDEPGGDSQRDHLPALGGEAPHRCRGDSESPGCALTGLRSDARIARRLDSEYGGANMRPVLLTLTRAAETPGPARTLRKLFHQIEADLQHRYDYQLRDALHRVQREGCGATVPDRD